MARLERPPSARFDDVLHTLDRRLRELENRSGSPGLVLTAPSGARVEVRAFSDGSAGVRVYSNAGALVHDLTAS